MQVYARGALGALLALAAEPASAQNLPPVAQLEAESLEPIVGSPVALTAAGSFDPDGGTSALSFAWDFDDGGTATGADVTHTFTEARGHRVRVTVSDGEARTEASATLFVLAPAIGGTSASSALALDTERVYVAEPIAERVVALDRAGASVAWAVDVPAPRTLAVSPDGGELWVACGDGVLRALGAAAGESRRAIRLGSELHGLAIVPGDGRVVVTSPSDGVVHVLGADLAGGAAVAVGGDPRAVAIDANGRAYVPSFLTRAPADAGLVSVLDLDAGRVIARLPLALDTSPDTLSSGGGVPNLLATAAVAPSGETLWIGGTKSNTGRGLWEDGRELTPENRVRGLLAPLALPGGEDRAGARIDTNDAGRVAALGLSPRGRYAYVTHPGVGALSIYDLPAAALYEGREPGATVPFESRLELGPTPDALAVGADGRVFVRLREALELVVVDVRDPSSPLVAARVSLGADPRPDTVSLGARLFHSSRDPVLSRGGYVACAACHPGGAMDGRTWDFTQAGEGLRNTIDLRGRAGLMHGPLHWSANFDEVQDFENDIVLAFGGEGLAGDGEGPHPPLGERPNAGRSRELDALADYVASLDAVPDSPFRDRDGTLTAAGERGRRLFFDAQIGCAGCHAPPRFTDSSFDGALHDVGTLRASSGDRLGEPLEGIDTPTLLGSWATAPYLHDGRAADLRAVLTRHNPDDRHGRTSHLTAGEIDDLAAYVRQIDAREAERPPPGGCGVSPSARGLAPFSGLLLILALGAARRRSTP